MKADLQAEISDIRNLLEAAEEEQGEVTLNLQPDQRLWVQPVATACFPPPPFTGTRKVDEQF